MENKVLTLKEAVAKYVKNEDHVVIGGFTTNRKPYALVYEILRQGFTDFVGEGGPAGGDWDMLIGCGRIKAYINCYTANSGVTNVCRRYRKWFEAGKLHMEDYSQDVIMLMLHAASLGLPYLPVRLMMGTDLVNKWGISKEIRKTIPKLPDDKFIYVENPFNPGEKVVAVPVPEIDLALIHVQKASPDGTCAILGDEFHDVDIAIAGKRCIVTCEELVSNEEIRKNPTENSIPGFCVDAVVHLPYGAHPTQCYGYYDYDNNFLKLYDRVSKTQEDFDAFIQEWVYDVPNHEAYINKLGASRLVDLNIVPGLGYATKGVK
ncbi:glutaconate CoA-transferase subunit A [Fusobacterium sp. MFO224]|uniref:glutaconate CoA-transferase subunit A n=1 Tax=Fusobacterium sp. MFO224 TaxID=3378070 RepID=UPI003853B5C7